jgi:antitoxin component YwqK of YwqJK toxin-antitoxin module
MSKKKQKLLVRKREKMTLDEDLVLRELKKISKILTLANSSIIENELAKIAGTNERKKMWMLLDGERMPTDIAREVGVSAMAVSYFLNSGKVAELINYERGKPPTRALDYIPPNWIDLLKMPAEETGQQEQNKTEPEVRD